MWNVATIIVYLWNLSQINIHCCVYHMYIKTKLLLCSAWFLLPSIIFSVQLLSIPCSLYIDTVFSRYSCRVSFFSTIKILILAYDIKLYQGVKKKLQKLKNYFIHFWTHFFTPLILTAPFITNQSVPEFSLPNQISIF